MRYTAPLAVAGLLGLSATVFGGCLLDYEPPPKPVSNWTVEEARRFNDFPLYWLGESYSGHSLTSIRLTIDGDGVTHASFSYGEPSLAGSPESQSWLPPLEVDIQPHCGYSPEEHVSYGDEGEIVEIRGVSGYLRHHSSSNASLFVWTGSSTVHLRTWKSEIDVEAAAVDLIPIAGDTGATLQPFPSPTTISC